MRDAQFLDSSKLVQKASRLSSGSRENHRLYKEQATRDYQLLRSTKEQSIVLAHLANKQSLENLELNSRLLRPQKSNDKPQDLHGSDHKRLHYQA